MSKAIALEIENRITRVPTLDELKEKYSPKVINMAICHIAELSGYKDTTSEEITDEELTCIWESVENDYPTANRDLADLAAMIVRHPEWVDAHR